MNQVYYSNTLFSNQYRNVEGQQGSVSSCATIHGTQASLLLFASCRREDKSVDAEADLPEIRPGTTHYEPTAQSCDHYSSDSDASDMRSPRPE